MCVGMCVCVCVCVYEIHSLKKGIFLKSESFFF